MLHGLYWLVANLADRRPLLLILDDAHWIDPASARFLLYLARRIESLPVCLLAAARPGEGADPIGVVPALSAVADTILRPSPLSELGAGVLVRRELGPRADDELCRSCREATGGNPFYLQALTAALLTEGGRPTVELARHVRALGTGALGRSLLVRCGAFALAERAREESVAAGARPRREALSGPGALTPAELRTARMATEGLTNREIAQALFVSTKTVETHLSHAYAKLGIQRRAELSAALAAAGGAAAVLA